MNFTRNCKLQKKLKCTFRYSNVSYKSLIDIEPLSSTLHASNTLHPPKSYEKVKNLTFDINFTIEMLIANVFEVYP